jgi:hypothetical protein
LSTCKISFKIKSTTSTSINCSSKSSTN